MESKQCKPFIFQVQRCEIIYEHFVKFVHYCQVSKLPDVDGRTLEGTDKATLHISNPVPGLIKLIIAEDAWYLRKSY